MSRKLLAIMALIFALVLLVPGAAAARPDPFDTGMDEIYPPKPQYLLLLERAYDAHNRQETIILDAVSDGSEQANSGDETIIRPSRKPLRLAPSLPMTLSD